MTLNSPVTWIDFEAFIKFCEKEKVDGFTRLILASDGSVTRLLEVLSLTRADVDILFNREASLNKEGALILEMDRGTPAIFREVFLKVQDTPMVYASSYISIDGLNQPFYHEIVKQKKSIGSLMGEYHYPALRDKMGFCKGPWPDIRPEFGIHKNESVWARRYRLKVDRILQAFITEIFSPRLFEFFK